MLPFDEIVEPEILGDDMMLDGPSVGPVLVLKRLPCENVAFSSEDADDEVSLIFS